MNILFIGGDGSLTNANSVCVSNMAHEMQRCGHKVWVLSLGDGPEQIPDSYYGKLKTKVSQKPYLLRKLWFKAINVVRHVALLPFYPDVAPCRSRKVARKAKEIVQKNRIEVVVAIFNVYENIYAGIKLKKWFGNDIKVVSYHLDIRTSSVNPSKLIRNYIYKHALASLVEENKAVDKMMIPYSGKEDVEKLKGMDFSKVHFVGFPVFIKETEILPCELPFDKESINITYIGSLSLDNRNPNYILTLIKKTADILNRKIMVHFWGDMDDALPMLEESPVAIYHSKIDNKYVRYLMDNSDFLLNIGNTMTYSMLPSKVFGMFATGKPIINVIKNQEDAIQPYFEKYNHSIDLKEYQKASTDSTLLADGISNLIYSPLKDCQGLFDDFTPAAICNIILKEK